MRKQQGGPPRPTLHSASIYSVPKRDARWGDARYRGNCDGTLVLDLIRRYQPQSVADPMEGSGTVRDVVQWVNQKRPAQTRVSYWGGDLRDGFNAEREAIPGKHDLIWVHPPYWDIIRYSESAADLSATADYETFRDRLQRCLLRCARSLSPGGRLAVLVGDVRKRGKYYSLSAPVLELESRIGTLRAVLIKAQHNCASDRKNYDHLLEAPIRHEYCVVFQSDRVKADRERLCSQGGA